MHAAEDRTTVFAALLSVPLGRTLATSSVLLAPRGKTTETGALFVSHSPGLRTWKYFMLMSLQKSGFKGRFFVGHGYSLRGE